MRKGHTQRRLQRRAYSKRSSQYSPFVPRSGRALKAELIAHALGRLANAGARSVKQMLINHVKHM